MQNLSIMTMTEEELLEYYHYRVMLSKSKLWDLTHPKSKFYSEIMRQPSMDIKNKKIILLRLLGVFEGRISNYNNKKENR